MTNKFESVVKLLSTLGAAVAFIWGVIQFVISQNAQAEVRRIEATTPFLERQLKLYTEATQLAATLSTSKNPAEVSKSTTRFWSLYWGELALVENGDVESAMVGFGRALDEDKDQAALRPLSLKLAHACRESLAESWGVREWRQPGTDKSPVQ